MLIDARNLQSCNAHLMVRFRPATAPAQCRGMRKAWLMVLLMLGHHLRRFPGVAPGPEALGLFSPAAGAVEPVHDGQPAAVLGSQLMSRGSEAWWLQLQTYGKEGPEPGAYVSMAEMPPTDERGRRGC